MAKKKVYKKIRLRQGEHRARIKYIARRGNRIIVTLEMKP